MYVLLFKIKYSNKLKESLELYPDNAIIIKMLYGTLFIAFEYPKTSTDVLVLFLENMH